MSTPKAPKAPDPKETAAAQTSTNVATAQANAIMGNVNQVTPYGNLTYTSTGQNFISDPTSGQTYWKGPNGQIQSNAPGMVSSTGGSTTTKQPIYRATSSGQKVIQGYRDVTTPGKTTTSTPDGWSQVKGYYVPSYTATQTLSPQQQKILEQNQAAELNLAGLANSQSKRLQGLLDTPFTLDGLPAMGGVGGNGQVDFSKDRGRVEEALLSRLNPSIANDRAALEQKLADAGVVAGSAAYDRAVDEANRAATDARYGAILAGGQEQSRLVGLQNQARNQALTERFAERNQPLNEIASLLSGAQVTNPNFVNSNMPQIATTDYAGLVQNQYQSQLAQYNQAQAQRQALLGGVLGIGAAFAGNPALKFSDRRLKTDIKKVGKTNDGQNLYSYRYKAGGPQEIGLMAQEVEKKRPDAVKNVGGYKAVDYSKALPGLLSMGDR